MHTDLVRRHDVTVKLLRSWTKKVV